MRKKEYIKTKKNRLKKGDAMPSKEVDGIKVYSLNIKNELKE